MTPRLAFAARLLILLCALLAATRTAAQSTYAADSSPAAAAAYPWLDISGSGSAVALNDNAVSAPIALGFTFAYGSVSYTQVRIASNGMLQFGGTSTASTNAALPLDGSGAKPSIDAVMLPLWDDLNPGNTSSYIRRATLGSAPNRVFVVSWLAVPYWCANDNPSACNPAKNQTKNAFATFQVQVHEQGQFVYRYQAVNGSGGAHTGGATMRNPAGATVGYELSDGDQALYAFHTPSVPNGTTIVWSRRLNAPGRFNAFETSTPAGSISGVIKTKVAATPFTLAVVALNIARTAILPTFTGEVKVELLDSSDNSGPLDATSGCRSSWSAAPGSSTQTLTFAAADAGRKNITLGESGAWRNVRLRISYPATGPATVLGCSTDNFAIRPAAFNGVSVRDTDAQTAGTARTLSNIAAAGGVVHKAGRPFTLSATAANAAGTVATRYDGTPEAAVSACAGAACTATLGELTLNGAAAAGVLTASDARYSEVGAFRLVLSDSSFAGVDLGDGSTASEMTFSSTALDVGRFVPDHFELMLLVTPQLKTFNDASCAARSFTYIGQPFGYASAPQALVTARNADGDTTVGYAGALWTLNGSHIEQTHSPLAPAVPALDVSGVAAPTVTSNGDGTGVVAATAGSLLKFTRPTAAPLAPFDADIALTWSASDSSEAVVAGNGSIGTAVPLTFASIAFDAGNAFRYGVLKASSAYGSEMNNLAVPVQALYWNGTAFVAHGGDHCTALSTAIVAMGNYQRSLAACETALAPATVPLNAGRGVFTLIRPGAGNAGSVDLTLQLGASAAGQTCSSVGGAPVAAAAGAMPWLQGKWNGSAGYDANPAARASFGQYRSPMIYLREAF